MQKTVNQKIYYCVYVSSAVNLMATEDLLSLLSTCRKNNSRLEITGMLLHKDGNFMQVLEGPESEVRSLIEKIKKDSRHRGIIILAEGYTDSRQFVDWSMGFHELNSPEAKLVPGYNEFLNVSLTEAEFASNSSRCQLLLQTFRNYATGPGRL